MAIVKRKTREGLTFQVKVLDRCRKWYPTRSFRNLDEAQAEEARLNALKRKGLFASTHEAKTVTVQEYWEVWSQENRTDTSEGWKISEDQMYRDHLAPVLGSHLMVEVNSPMIGRALNRMKERGLSDQTRLHAYTLVHKMFRDAVEYYEMLGANPAKARFHRPKVRKVHRSFLPPAQAFHLLDHSRTHRYMGPPVWCQTLAGLRVEAVMGLDWSAIYWDTDQILIRRAWKQKVGRMEDFPKGRDWEYVPMTPLLKDYLWGIWVSLGRPSEGFVCPGVKGGMLPYETYLRALRRLCESAGVPLVTTHELRHTCTELFVNAGANAEDLRRLLNHKSVATTMRYIHRTDERLNAVAGMIKAPELRLVEGGVSSFPKSFPSGKQKASAYPLQGSADAV
jgi:integrase